MAFSAAIISVTADYITQAPPLRDLFNRTGRVLIKQLGNNVSKGCYFLVRGVAKGTAV